MIRTSSGDSGAALPSTCDVVPNSWLMQSHPESLRPDSAKNHMPSCPIPICASWAADDVGGQENAGPELRMGVPHGIRIE